MTPPRAQSLVNAFRVIFRGQDASALRSRSIDASGLTTAQRARIAAEVNDRAFFSSKVSDARLLERMRGYIADAAEGRRGFGREDFVKTMRRELGAEPEDPSRAGSLTDIASSRRLRLIYDFQRERLSAEIRAEKAKDGDFAELFPAQELVRQERRRVPRDWRERWTKAGGRLSAGGRMIALRDAPIWRKISRFGSPLPPFDFNSGMGLEDVSRAEARRMGVLPGARDEAAASSAGANVRWRPIVPEDDVPELRAALERSAVPAPPPQSSPEELAAWVRANFPGAEADFAGLDASAARGMSRALRAMDALGMKPKGPLSLGKLTGSDALGTSTRTQGGGHALRVSARADDKVATADLTNAYGTTVHEITHALFDHDAQLNAPREIIAELDKIHKAHSAAMGEVEAKRRRAARAGRAQPKYPLQRDTRKDFDEFLSAAVEDYLLHGKGAYALSKKVFKVLAKFYNRLK